MAVPALPEKKRVCIHVGVRQASTPTFLGNLTHLLDTPPLHDPRTHSTPRAPLDSIWYRLPLMALRAFPKELCVCIYVHRRKALAALHCCEFHHVVDCSSRSHSLGVQRTTIALLSLLPRQQLPQYHSLSSARIHGNRVNQPNSSANVSGCAGQISAQQVRRSGFVLIVIQFRWRIGGGSSAWADAHRAVFALALSNPRVGGG